MPRASSSASSRRGEGEAIGAAFDDERDAHVRVWFQRQDINAAHGDCGRAVQTAARANTYHPVRDYFAGRKWDSTVRLDDWLSIYLGVESTPFTRAVGSRGLDRHTQ
jgi:predicted P-loop ATPase